MAKAETPQGRRRQVGAAKGEAKAEAVKASSCPKDYTPRLKKVYNETIRKALKDQFNYDNEMQVPRLDKIVLNMGVGEATGDSKKPSVAAEDALVLIAGQKAVVTHARKSIAASRCARRCRSAPGRRSARSACTSSWTAWSPSRCRACATSAA